MSKKLLLISLVLIFAEVSHANHGAPKDCYTCANLNNGNNFMCDWGGFIKVKDKIACCENKESRYC